MGWTRRANPRWSRKVPNPAKQTDYDINVDRHGNTARNHWATTWTTGSTRWAKRTTNRQQRWANHLKIKLGVEDHLDDLKQAYLDQFEWYDDEPMDLPDWWYEPWDDYEYPEEPFYDPYDDYFDDGYQV